MSSLEIEPSCCPVCRREFDGSIECRGCGADIESLVLLDAKAYILREAARRCLATDENAAAWRLIRRARKLKDSPLTQRLETIINMRLEQENSGG